jgi:hypothetical protein
MTEFFGISVEMWQTLIAAILAIYGYWKTKQVQVLTVPDTTSTVVQKVIVPTLPATSWKMSDAIKRWLTFDCPAESRTMILDQIAKAEAANLIKYRVVYPGGWYDVEYGALVGDAGNCGKATG